MNPPTNIEMHIRESSIHVVFTTNCINIYDFENAETYMNLEEWSNYEEGVIDYSKISKAFTVISKIDEYDGYWSNGIYEGKFKKNANDACMVKLNNNNEYLMIMGQDRSLNGVSFKNIKRVKLNESILSAIYGICSGGDSGSYYAVSENYVYDWFYNTPFFISKVDT